MKKSSFYRKVLFAYDGPLYRTETGQFCNLTLNDNLRVRYLHLGETVTFLTRVRGGEVNSKAEQSTIKSEQFNVVEIVDFKSIKKLPNSYQAEKGIRNAVNKHDIIVARIPSSIGTLAIKHAKLLKKPLMVEVVGCTFDAYWNYSLFTKLIAHYKMRVQKKAVADAPFAIYVTESFLQSRYPSKAKQINCSNVDLQELNPQVLIKRQKKIDLTAGKRELTLGTVSSLNVPFKAQGDVIRALAQLKKEKRLNFKYQLVGQGNPDRLIGLIKKLDLVDNVEIIGSLQRHDVFRFLDDIDIYIHPSKQEGLPRAVIEAMSRACPVLGSDTAGIPELLNHDDIFEAGNVEEIKSKLVNVAVDWMRISANRNFNKAKEFQSKVLKKRRYSFFENFLSSYGLPIPERLKWFKSDMQ